MVLVTGLDHGARPLLKIMPAFCVHWSKQLCALLQRSAGENETDKNCRLKDGKEKFSGRTYHGTGQQTELESLQPLHVCFFSTTSCCTG